MSTSAHLDAVKAIIDPLVAAGPAAFDVIAGGNVANEEQPPWLVLHGNANRYSASDINGRQRHEDFMVYLVAAGRSANEASEVIDVVTDALNERPAVAGYITGLLTFFGRQPPTQALDDPSIWQATAQWVFETTKE